jgi:hypothetical protein
MSIYLIWYHTFRNMDKPPANKEDIMERKKDLFERRRLNRINNKESDLNLRESNSK